MTLLASQEDFSRLPLALDELGQAVSRVWGLSCATGASRPFDRWSGCHGACREAVDALRFSPPGTDGIRRVPQAGTAPGKSWIWAPWTKSSKGSCAAGAKAS